MTIRLFPFGFMYSKAAELNFLGNTLNWSQVTTPDSGQLWVSEDNPKQSYYGKSFKAIWLGHSCWIGDEAISGEKIAKFSVETLERGGWQELHEAMDLIVGRYVAFIWSETEFRVYHDSTALRPVYFNLNDGYIVSHGPLLRNLRNASGQYSHPLVNLGQHKLWEETEDPDVSALPPNFYIDVQAKTIRRFYPHSPLRFQQQSRAQRQQRALELARRSMKYWGASKLKVHCALTGGLDTRINAAAALGSGLDINYVTYGAHGKLSESDSKTERSYKNDFLISSSIAEALNLDQSLLSVQDSVHFQLTNEELEILGSNNFRSHASRFQGLYESTLGTEGSLCFVGTAFGSMRDHFVSGRLPMSPFDEFKAALRVIAGFSKGPRGGALTDSHAAELWDRYELQTAVENNFPIANLLCIELRAGRFQNEAINCQSTAFLPINPLAIREFFEISQAYTFKQRKNSDFLHAFIANIYPALAAFPVNEQPRHNPIEDITSNIKIKKGTLHTTIELAEDAPQNRNDRICLEQGFLYKGAAKWFERQFSLSSGALSLSIKNGYFLGRAATNLEIFVSVNYEIVEQAPLGLRNSPYFFHIEGLKNGDVIGAGIRATRDNGPAWAKHAVIDLLEWSELEKSAHPTLAVGSTAHMKEIEY